MKKIIAIMALALGLAACGGSEKAPTTYVNIGTGGTAGTYYPLGGAFAEIWNTNIEGVNATAESTGASVANVNMLQKGDIDVAIIQNDVASYAENGVELFENKVENIRGMATLYSEPIQCITTDGSVKSISDLKGKKVAIGAFLIPYMFVISPDLIMINPGPTVISSIITAVIGICCVSIGLTGFFKVKMNVVERVLFIVAGLLTLKPGYKTDLLGLVLIVVVYYIQNKKIKNNK